MKPDVTPKSSQSAETSAQANPKPGAADPVSARRRFLRHLGRRALYLTPVFMTMTAQEAYASGGTSAS